MLDGCGGNQRDSVERIHEQSCIHKLVREERAISVIEEGAQLHRSRCSVNLVVDGKQLARGYFGSLGAIPRLDGQCMHLPHPRLHLPQTVFRHREDHGSGLHLCNHHQHRACSCLHYISGIDEAKACAAGNRSGNVAVTELDLAVVHGALIVLHRALVLKHNLLLVIQQLLLDPVSSPSSAIPSRSI